MFVRAWVRLKSNFICRFDMWVRSLFFLFLTGKIMPQGEKKEKIWGMESGVVTFYTTNPGRGGGVRSHKVSQDFLFPSYRCSKFVFFLNKKLATAKEF